ncbi:MAG: GNAT family N-acetyltransferase [Saprospiraceae bacterium]|nr:GNAT family N-acetyltransferase [Saprospiraceae bacterium]
MKIEILSEINKSALERLHQLMKQLCPTCPPLNLDHYKKMIDHPTTLLIVSKKEDLILGCLTLAWYPIPTGLRMWIEDVVVDENYHGRHIGEELVFFAMKQARQLGGRILDLTSRPDRIAANKLYQKLGFEKRVTNPYRLKL